jgi:hypothetical protein
MQNKKCHISNTRQQNVYKNNSNKVKLLCIKIFYVSENESSIYLISIYQQMSSKNLVLHFPYFYQNNTESAFSENLKISTFHFRRKTNHHN